jgi:hypothetical protein
MPGGLGMLSSLAHWYALWYRFTSPKSLWDDPATAWSEEK